MYVILFVFDLVFDCIIFFSYIKCIRKIQSFWEDLKGQNDSKENFKKEIRIERVVGEVICKDKCIYINRGSRIEFKYSLGEQLLRQCSQFSLVIEYSQ